MEKYLTPIFEVINNPEIPFILAFGIIGFAIYLWFWFYLRAKKISRELNAAIKVVEGTPNNEREFYEHYMGVKDELLENKLLRHTWSEFTENLIISEEHHLIRNSYDAGSYFSIANIVSKRINLQFYQSVPNKLVGLGLLFTFFGLVAALYFASKGVNSADIEVAKAELAKLLHAATFKFSTSIAGLISSLFFSWGEKHQLYGLSKKLDYFCRLLDERLAFVTPEIIAEEQLKEVKKHTEQLERFNTDLAISIAEALEKPVANALNQELAPLISAISGMASNIGGMNQNALEKMMKDFGDQLHASAGKEMSELGQTLSGLAGSIQLTTDNLQSGMEQMVSNLGDQVNQLSSTLNKSAVDFSSSVTNSAQAMDNQLSQTFGGLTESISKFTSGAEQLSVATQGMHGLIQKIQSLLIDFDNPIKEIKEAGVPLGRISATLQQLSTQMSQEHQIAENMISGFKQASDDIRQTSAHVRDTLTTYQQNFDKVDDSTSKVFDEINRGLHAYTSSIKDFVVGIDESFSKALSSLSSAIVELQEVVEESSGNKQS